MNTTSSITFYCRKGKANAAGLASIEVCVTICGERITSTLPRRCAPKEFRAYWSKLVDKIGTIFVYWSKIVDKCGSLPAFSTCI